MDRLELDEPLGMNDGAVKGHRYFSCRPSHGLFSRPAKLQLIERERGRPPPPRRRSSRSRSSRRRRRRMRPRWRNPSTRH